MSDSLLIFSIGPVQRFISEARRAQDLWAGSTWLSETTRAALHACLVSGAQFIYPSDAGQRSIPNRFVVRLPSEQVEAVARGAAVAAKEAFRAPARTAQQALAELVQPVDDEWQGIWARQLHHHLEVYWAAAPIDEGGYDAAYDATNRAFEAAKRTRVFEQVEEDGFKDSLSGSRSALRTATMDAREYWQAVASRVNASVLRPDGRERLDAMGAGKRFGFDSRRFPSVSTVAAAAFLLRAASEQPDLLAAHARNVGRLGVFSAPAAADRLPALAEVSWPYDGDLLYAESLAAKRLESDYGLQPAEGEIARTRASLAALTGALDAAPSRYYAILTMDGDAMGEHVSVCRSAEHHTDLSGRLAAFAAQATDIIEQRHAGRVIYAGGDDLLALLPLPDPGLVTAEAEGNPAGPDPVLAACELGEAYAALFSGWPVEALPRRGGEPLPFSASAGLAIVHHRYPLSAALAAARQAERDAKAMDGKAALAVRVLVRSGEPTQACARWQGLAAHYAWARAFFAQGKLSPRLAHYLAEAAPAFTAPGPQQAFASELRRVAVRQRNPRKLDDAAARKFAEQLAAWAAEVGLGPEVLAAWLVVADFCVREGGAE